MPRSQMTFRALIASGAAATLLLGACDRTADNSTAAATGTSEALGPDTIATSSMAPPGAAGGAAGAQLPLTAQAFVDAAAASDLYEMGAAELADNEKHSSQVRAYAQMMMRDHAKSSQALKAALNQSNASATVDNQKMMPDQEASLEALRNATPQQFDALYAKQQVAAHEKTLAILQTYGQSGDSPALMAFANKIAPVVSAHLEAARKLPQ